MRNRRARRVVVLLAITGALMVGCAGDTQVDDAEREVALAQAEAAQRWAPVRTTVWYLSTAAAPILVLTVALTYAWQRAGLVNPRKHDGALPFKRRRLTADDARAALSGRLAADLAVAQQQPVPQSLTWSPSYRNSQDIQAGGVPGELPAVTPPSMAQVLTDVTRVHLGTADTGPVDRPWDQLLTLAIGGMSGSGKTTVGASIALQSLAAGHRVVLCDPQSADEQSLAA
ncbi:MAG: hypothetical protein GEU78_18490, partial [Actinobacteria bacterium]|nr:hypothetical protein [Actinomycetota bacterium]